MSKITCEICGSNEIKKEQDEFICQNCGVKYSTEKLRNILNRNDSNNLESQDIKNIHKQTMTLEQKAKEELYIQEIENAIADANVKKAIQLLHFISDHNKAELLRCRLILATGTISDPKFHHAITGSGNYELGEEHGFRYLVENVREEKSLYRYLSVKYIIEHFLKLFKTLDDDITIEKVKKDSNYFSFFHYFYDYIVPFCSEDLIWEFCLALKERTILKTEEEVKNAIEKIKTEVETGQSENLYDFFTNYYKDFFDNLDIDQNFDQDAGILPFLRKILEITK